MTSEELLTVLAALGHPLRLQIIAALAAERVHVSELARRVGVSRPLLYMHLERLEKAGLVEGHLELSHDGKSMKYIELKPFQLTLTVPTILAALQADRESEQPSSGERSD
ncbi:ArsR/SmtB family transcription factor [Sinosporangium siamense]|uniref:Transcriptional regulator n=1 Tax=Sinosporangium siamense TaxID=1367973 RepID=A0A919RLX7_9ACTN|nr:winged helix-turn-helix domain-containing protein [Sinosporangium siamense]GII94556.1 transcriptional regulator [Sinosporangium siamense]